MLLASRPTSVDWLRANCANALTSGLVTMALNTLSSRRSPWVGRSKVISWSPRDAITSPHCAMTGSSLFENWPCTPTTARPPGFPHLKAGIPSRTNSSG